MSETKPLSIYIGTPMYGGNCKDGFTQSLLSLQYEFFKYKIDVAFDFVANESLITRARNTIANNFLKTDFDYLLFIDSDHRFEADGIVKMIQDNKDIICGICALKEINWLMVSNAVNNGVFYDQLSSCSGLFNFTVLNDLIPSDFNKSFEVNYGGSGIMLIKRQVFEKLSNVLPKYRPHDNNDEQYTEFFSTSIDHNGMLLSEDYNFCKQWRQIGGTVWAAPYLKNTHIGHYEFSGDLEKTANMLKNRK